jgi:curved DNA-binding protein CbpA
MRESPERPSLPSDPRAVLEVAPEATDEQIRAAYLRKVKQFPPDRNPVEFERVRDAYELLRDRRQRMRRLLLALDPQAPLESLLEMSGSHTRKFVGPEAWLAVLKEK